MALSEGNGMYMPVAPAYGGMGGGFDSCGDWFILFIIAMMFGGGFGMGGFGGFGGGFEFPWLLAANNNTDNNVQAGFNQLATSNALGDIQNGIISGFGDVQTALCGGFAGVNTSINGAQSAITQQMYSNQIADLERSFNAQTASMQGMNGIQAQLAQASSDNKAATADVKYTIANEACQNRATSTANTQAILDKLCALELDGYKRENDNLRTQLNMATLKASQVEQNAFIQQGLNNEVDQLYNRLSNCPVPSTPVYGRTPIFTCNQNGCGCGM